MLYIKLSHKLKLKRYIKAFLKLAVYNVYEVPQFLQNVIQTTQVARPDSSVGALTHIHAKIQDLIQGFFYLFLERRGTAKRRTKNHESQRRHHNKNSVK